jgi:hypothetical protein
MRLYLYPRHLHNPPKGAVWVALFVPALFVLCIAVSVISDHLDLIVGMIAVTVQLLLSSKLVTWMLIVWVALWLMRRVLDIVLDTLALNRQRKREEDEKNAHRQALDYLAEIRARSEITR